MKSKINVWIAINEVSKKEVAEKLGVSQVVLSRWINNHNKPSLEKAFQLAGILNCKVDDLYEREEGN